MSSKILGHPKNCICEECSKPYNRQAESSFAAPSGSASGANSGDIELLKDAENAIDALLIFGHQHAAWPLLKEMAVLERIRRRLKTPNSD